MNKGLEALESIENALKFFYQEDYKITRYVKEIDTIEKELNEGEFAIDFVNKVYDIIGGENDTDIITDTIEKQKKVLEIIKKKRVNVDLFLLSDNVEDYNKHCHKYINVKTQLTPEEYDLLKEMLNNE